MSPLGKRTCCCRALSTLLLMMLVFGYPLQIWGEDQPGILSSNTNQIGNQSLSCRRDSQYKCASGTWICDIQRCDGVDDCEGGDDEAGCVCGNGMFLCDFRRCMEMDKRCDINQDCQDNTDEEGCVFITGQIGNQSLSCRGDSQYKCASGTWICDIQRCDGVDDCEGGDDEAGCVCGNGMFLCDSTRCMEIDKRCDIIQDCQDNTDEEGCVFITVPTTTTTTTQPPLTCPSAEQGPKVCDDGVTQSCFCDDKVECPTREDEALTNCQDKECRHWEWQCGDGSCIAKRHHCDGVQNCRDNTDEQNCPEWWICNNGQFILRKHRCDGYCHCHDMSDERSCRPWFG